LVSPDQPNTSLSRRRFTTIHNMSPLIGIISLGFCRGWQLRVLPAEAPFGVGRSRPPADRFELGNREHIGIEHVREPAAIVKRGRVRRFSCPTAAAAAMLRQA
jgi:hypothetical protein